MNIIYWWWWWFCWYASFLLDLFILLSKKLINKNQFKCKIRLFLAGYFFVVAYLDIVVDFGSGIFINLKNFLDDQEFPDFWLVNRSFAIRENSFWKKTKLEISENKFISLADIDDDTVCLNLNKWNEQQVSFKVIGFSIFEIANKEFLPNMSVRYYHRTLTALCVWQYWWW